MDLNPKKCKTFLLITLFVRKCSLTAKYYKLVTMFSINSCFFIVTTIFFAFEKSQSVSMLQITMDSKSMSSKSGVLGCLHFKLVFVDMVQMIVQHHRHLSTSGYIPVVDTLFVDKSA